MTCFLIITEFGKHTADQDRQDLLKFVKTLNGIEINDSTFAIQSEYDNAEEVFELLKIYLGDSNVLIMKISLPFHGQFRSEVFDWFYSHLEECNQSDK